jgi:CubicO group peptidase (beta-lactamase class C family)
MNIRNSFLILFISLLIAGTACTHQSQWASLEREIDELIPSAVNDTTPGLIVGVVQNGEVIFQKGYGLANLNYDIPNDPEMVYNIGSVAKQFLGYAFAMQHAAGTLNIDDPVGDYLEEWPEFEETVTIRHLLNHSSGYREAYTMSNLAGRSIGVDRMAASEAMEVVRRQPALEFSPDSRYTYNSTAWVILAEIFEEATGELAAAWVEENILDALGMNDTQIETHVGQVIENAAESYSYSDEIGYTNEKSNRAIFGAADVFMNVPDAVKWINNMKTGELGGQEVLDLFLEPNVLNNGINSEYALGIRVGEYRGLRRYRHTGGHAAFGTQLSYYPDHDLGIFIVSNYSRGWLPSERIAELVLGGDMEQEISYEDERMALSDEMQVLLPGMYINEDRNDMVELHVDEGKLMVGGNTELIPVGGGVFRVNGSTNRYDIEINNEGNETVRVTATGTDGIRVFEKMDAWEPGASELRRYAGEYRSDEIDSIMRFSINDEGMLQVHHRWIGTLHFQPLARDIFQAGNGMMAEFVSDGSGNVTGFYANSGRTLDVWFGRE